MADFVGAERLVVSCEARQNREPRSVGRGPAVGSPRVRLHIEERTGSGVPRCSVVEHVVKFVQITVVPIDDDQVSIAARSEIDVARFAAFDPVRLSDGFAWNRIERKALVRRVVNAVALVRVGELNRLLRQRAIHHGVRKSVDLDAAW